MDSWKLSRYKQFSTEHSNKNLHKYMILYWLNYDKSCQFCVSSDEKHWWPHGHQHRVIWKLQVFFGTKKLEGMKKVWRHWVKEGRQGIFLFLYRWTKIQNPEFWELFFFNWSHHFEWTYYICISFEHFSVCFWCIRLCAFLHR